MSRLAAALEGAVSVEAAPSRRGLVRDTSALVERNAVVGPGPTARPAEVIDRVIDRERLPVDGSEARVAPETLAQSVVGRKRRQKKSRSRSFFFLRRAGFLGRADGVEPRRLRAEGKIRRRLKRGGGVGRGPTVREPRRARREGLAASGENRPPRGDARGRARRRAIAVGRARGGFGDAGRIDAGARRARARVGVARVRERGLPARSRAAVVVGDRGDRGGAG